MNELQGDMLPNIIRTYESDVQFIQDMKSYFDAEQIEQLLSNLVENIPEEFD